MGERLWKHPKHKTWHILWEEDGRTRRQSLKTGDSRIARQRFLNLRREIISGRNRRSAPGSGKRFYEFCEEFMGHIRATREESTSRLYSAALEKAKTVWQDIPLSKIGPREIDSLTAYMAGNGLSAPTINKNLRHIKAALRQAFHWEYMEKEIRFPKPIREKKENRFLSAEELRRIVQTMNSNPEFCDFCILSAYTGLRSGELLRLRRSDIDNPSGFIRVSGEQKNRTESRVPINAGAREVLDRTPGAGPDGRLFRFQDASKVSHLFKEYARKAGLPNVRFHDLRHTYASHLAMSGTDIQVIQKLMRHKSISSTMIYARLAPEYLKEQNEKLNYGNLKSEK